MSDSLRSRTLAPMPSFLALGCVGALASFPAQAQTAPATSGAQPDLGGVTVTDTAITEGSYRTDRLDSPKYTAPLVDTPRSISVIPQQLIKDTASTTLAEALRTVPGITMGAGEGGNPIGDRPFIRGFDTSNSTYIDGVRDLAAQVRETFDIDEIEVVKGSDSVTNGSGNAGGSINIVSKKPTAERFAEIDGSYGNADYKRATVDINQPLNDFIGFRLNGMYHDQHIAGRDDVWQKRWGIAPSLKIGLTGPTSLTVDFYHLHSNELPDSGIPYQTVLANQPDANDQTKPVGTSERPRGALLRADRSRLPAHRDQRRQHPLRAPVRQRLQAAQHRQLHACRPGLCLDAARRFEGQCLHLRHRRSPRAVALFERDRAGRPSRSVGQVRHRAAPAQHRRLARI